MVSNQVLSKQSSFSVTYCGRFNFQSTAAAADLSFVICVDVEKEEVNQMSVCFVSAEGLNLTTLTERMRHFLI